MRGSFAGIPVPAHLIACDQSQLALSAPDLRLLTYVRWPGRPPPTTVYLRAYLAALRARPDKPLKTRDAPPAVEPSAPVSTSTTERSRSPRLAPTPKRRLGASPVAPLAEPSASSGPSGGVPDELAESIEITAGDLILRSRACKSDAAAPLSRTDADAHVTPPALHAPATNAPPASQLMLREKFMRYAKDGMPTCALCLRRFAAWPPFLNHHHTNSCPAIDHADAPSTCLQAPSAASSVISTPSAVPPATSAPAESSLSSAAAPAKDSGPLISRSAIRDLAAQDVGCR